MDSGEEVVVNVALAGVVIFVVIVAGETIFPSLLKSMQTAIQNGVSNASDAAIGTAGAVVKGAGNSVFSIGGSDPNDVYQTLALNGNPESPGYNFLYGPNKFSFGSLWSAISTWWQETWNPALGSGASGGSAGGFPIGTDVSNYNPGNWDEVDYAPPPGNFDNPTLQGLINSMGWQS